MNLFKKGLFVSLFIIVLFFLSNLIEYLKLSNSLELFIRSMLVLTAVYIILEMLRESK